MHLLQPAILSYASKKISSKDLLSLFKDLNSELKDKQYLIEVNDNQQFVYDTIIFFHRSHVFLFQLLIFRPIVIYHQQIFPFGLVYGALYYLQNAKIFLDSCQTSLTG